MTSIALWCPLEMCPVFTTRHVARLEEMGTLIDARYRHSPAETLDLLAPAEAVVSTWGIPKVDADLLTCLPRLRGIFYAAGSVKGFVTPELYARGIVVSSAAPMNAVPVAEYTVGVILLANKRFWQVMRQSHHAISIPGNYHRTVGIIAASMVGREVIRLLRGYDLEVLLYDPYVSAADAAALGVTLVDLPTLMAQSDVVSLHAPNLPALRHMINADLLACMRDGATFINTARGALVDEAALLTEVQSGRLYAILDVTDPEPPVPNSPFYTLPNVIFTPHIAGSVGQECERMADFALDELARWLHGEPLRNAVPESALAHLA